MFPKYLVPETSSGCRLTVDQGMIQGMCVLNSIFLWFVFLFEIIHIDSIGSILQTIDHIDPMIVCVVCSTLMCIDLVILKYKQSTEKQNDRNLHEKEKTESIAKDLSNKFTRTIKHYSLQERMLYGTRPKSRTHMNLTGFSFVNSFGRCLTRSLEHTMMFVCVLMCVCALTFRAVSTILMCFPHVFWNLCTL